MEWNSNLIKNLQWSGEIINKAAKEKVGDAIAGLVKDGDVIGVGSGSTVFVSLFAIAKKVKAENLKIKFISTSLEISIACSSLGLPLTNIMEHKPDWLFDGADEVDPNNYLIKGRGGAMFKEKLLMSSSPRNYIIVDQSKIVSKLGINFPIPIEVFPESLLYVEQKLIALGATELILRLAKGKDGPIITENGNFILDARFETIGSDLEIKIKSITGVIESGLFQNCNFEVLGASRN